MFTLLALPHVAYRLVLKSMDFVDIVNLSLCTKTMSLITKDNMYQLKYWDVVVDKNLGIVFRRQFDEICVFGAVETEHGISEAAENICALFRSKVHTIRIENGDCWMLDWVNRTCQGISKVVYQAKNLSNGDLTDILKNCSAETLEIRTRPQKGFQFNQEFGNFKSFLSMTGDFLTIDNLMAMSCSKIQIGMPQFKSSDVNRFLRNWLNGGSPNLEFLRIGVSMLEEEIVLTGLEDYEPHIPEVRPTPYPTRIRWIGDSQKRWDHRFTLVQGFYCFWNAGFETINYFFGIGSREFCV